GLDVGRLDDERVAFPAAAAAAEPGFDRFRPGLELPRDRNDPCPEHLQRDRDVARRLIDADAVVIAERQHRSWEAAADAAIPAVEVGHPVEFGVRRPARTAGTVQRFGVRRHRRQLAVDRIDYHRGTALAREVLDPVAAADRLFLLLAFIGLLELLDPRL